MSKKSKSKASVTIEKAKDGTYDIRYKINDPEKVTAEDIAKLAEFVDEAIAGRWGGLTTTTS